MPPLKLKKDSLMFGRSARMATANLMYFHVNLMKYIYYIYFSTGNEYLVTLCSIKGVNLMTYV